MLRKILLLSSLALGASFTVNAQEKAEAIFASGCFWCTESDFEKVDGVIEAVSGYIGGKETNPTYKQVSAGRTGHTEAVKVTYDPSKVNYQKLLSVFWHNVDPTVKNRQFCDYGSQYRSGIFYLNPMQKEAAEKSLQDLKDSKRFKRIYTEITQATEFWPAEDYHQNYAKRNPWRYKYYRGGCGRDDRLRQLWGDQALEH